MAAGVCVLTSDIPENNEVVAGAGFTFHRGDRDDLERMLDLLVRNPELRRQSANRAQKRIQHEYAWPAIARAIERSYYEVLGWNLPEAAGHSVVSGCPAESVSLSQVPLA
jgi:glycosyltransferase involved in cell wall biosynthesis